MHALLGTLQNLPALYSLVLDFLLLDGGSGPVNCKGFFETNISYI